MLRAIIAGLLIYAIWVLWRRSARRRKTPDVADAARGTAEMIACRRCGTFVLDADAVRRGGEKFCSAECANGNGS